MQPARVWFDDQRLSEALTRRELGDVTAAFSPGMYQERGRKPAESRDVAPSNVPIATVGKPRPGNGGTDGRRNRVRKRLRCGV